MIFLKMALIVFLISPVSASNSDDEIIRNLDFFQSMEIVKEDATLISDEPSEIVQFDDEEMEITQ